MEVYQDIFRPAQEFLYQWRNLVDTFCVLVAVVGLALLAKYDLKTRRMLKSIVRGNIVAKEGQRARYKRLDGVVGGKFADMLVDLHLEGIIKDTDIPRYARRVSYVLDTMDAFPKAMQHEELTPEERRLLQDILRSKMELLKLLKGRTKPTIPGPKPGEVDNVVTFEQPKRKFGDQLRRKA